MHEPTKKSWNNYVKTKIIKIICIKPTKNEIKKHIKLQKALWSKNELSVFLKDATEGLLLIA